MIDPNELKRYMDKWGVDDAALADEALTQNGLILEELFDAATAQQYPDHYNLGIAAVRIVREYVEGRLVDFREDAA